MERKPRGPGLGKGGHFKRKMEMEAKLFLFLHNFDENVRRGLGVPISSFLGNTLVSKYTTPCPPEGVLSTSSCWVHILLSHVPILSLVPKSGCWGPGVLGNYFPHKAARAGGTPKKPRRRQQRWWSECEPGTGKEGKCRLESAEAQPLQSGHWPAQSSSTAFEVHVHSVVECGFWTWERLCM